MFVKMLMSLRECLKKYGSMYRVEESIRKGELRKVEPGVYSDGGDCTEVEILLVKYPKAVVTLQTAYYYYDLSDSLPDEVHLATDRNAAKIGDPRVLQHFLPSGTLQIGVVERSFGNETVARIYNLERLLIETVRNKTKLPYDLYKEVIESYRNRRNELYPAMMTDYLEAFPRKDALLRRISNEVF